MPQIVGKFAAGQDTKSLIVQEKSGFFVPRRHSCVQRFRPRRKYDKSVTNRFGASPDMFAIISSLTLCHENNASPPFP